MSILLEGPVATTNFTKYTYGVSKIYYILLISVAISIASIFLTYAGISYTEGIIKEYSERRDEKIGFEYQEMYRNPELFKLVLSYSDIR